MFYFKMENCGNGFALQETYIYSKILITYLLGVGVCVCAAAIVVTNVNVVTLLLRYFFSFWVESFMLHMHMCACVYLSDTATSKILEDEI